MRDDVNDFEEIRPYRDDEVAAVLRRLSRDRSLQRDLARYAAPSLSRWAPPLARWLIGRRLSDAFARIDSVDSFQQALAGVFQRMIDDTTDGFTVSGIERLEPDLAHLFISNHRDITLDSGFMNLALFSAGHPTTRMAIGDNLLRTGYAADVMRSNKGFVVHRGKRGAKLAFASMSLTSRYIRHSLETGQSVWTAQREGRAKDGRDLTDPALIKMLSLAYRKDLPDIGAMIERLSIVPVAVSYELDPCDELKARELARDRRARRVPQRAGEDLSSIITGVTGRKGRVHLSVGPAAARRLCGQRIGCGRNRSSDRARLPPFPHALHGRAPRRHRLSAPDEGARACVSSSGGSPPPNHACVRRSSRSTRTRWRGRWNLASSAADPRWRYGASGGSSRAESCSRRCSTCSDQ